MWSGTNREVVCLRRNHMVLIVLSEQNQKKNELFTRVTFQNGPNSRVVGNCIGVFLKIMLGVQFNPDDMLEL